jgi:hypothetical protein
MFRIVKRKLTVEQATICVPRTKLFERRTEKGFRWVVGRASYYPGTRKHVPYAFLMET